MIQQENNFCQQLAACNRSDLWKVKNFYLSAGKNLWQVGYFRLPLTDRNSVSKLYYKAKPCIIDFFYPLINIFNFENFQAAKSWILKHKLYKTKSHVLLIHSLNFTNKCFTQSIKVSIIYVKQKNYKFNFHSLSLIYFYVLHQAIIA